MLDKSITAVAAGFLSALITCSWVLYQAKTHTEEVKCYVDLGNKQISHVAIGKWEE